MSKISGSRIVKSEISIGDSYLLPLEQSPLSMQQEKIQRLLSDTDVQAQQIVDSAENKANVVLQAANVEAENIIKRARDKAQQEYEVIKQEAYKEGFAKGEADGFEKFQTDASEAINALETLSSSTFDMKKNIVESATMDIVDLVSAISDKVCHASFNKNILFQIALETIKLLNDKENITIIVNPILSETITSMVPTFKEMVSKLQIVKIIEDNSVSPDGVIVETPKKRLDGRISSQIGIITQQMLTGIDNDDLEQS